MPGGKLGLKLTSRGRDPVGLSSLGIGGVVQPNSSTTEGCTPEGLGP